MRVWALALAARASSVVTDSFMLILTLVIDIEYCGCNKTSRQARIKERGFKENECDQRVGREREVARTVKDGQKVGSGWEKEED